MSNVSTSDSPSTIDSTFFNAVIRVPPFALGSTTTVSYNNISYLVGSNTESWIYSEIGSWLPGYYSREVIATFAKETGYFPNPTVLFNVIHISDLSL